MLYALGSNGLGQLGLGHREDVSVPSSSEMIKSVAADEDIPIKVAAGGNHTLVLYNSGKIFLVGDASGHVDDQDDQERNRAHLLCDGIGLCAATWEASTLCTCNGDILFSCGKGSKGELGLGPEVGHKMRVNAERLSIPGLGKDGLRVVDIDAGMQHTVVVLSDGTAYGWGNGRKGQLGEPSGVVWYPRKIEKLDFKAIKVACGREFTFLVGVSETGQHAVLGSDKSGVKTDSPQDVKNWMQIGAGWGSIFVLFKDGSIKSWGRNDHGQLAPRGLPPIQTFASGSEHSLALTQDGKVLSWGWGEHGNCGPKTDEDGDVKDGFGEIFIPDRMLQRIVGLGAGCATSWIWD